MILDEEYLLQEYRKLWSREKMTLDNEERVKKNCWLDENSRKKYDEERMISNKKTVINNDENYKWMEEYCWLGTKNTLVDDTENADREKKKLLMKKTIKNVKEIIMTKENEQWEYTNKTRNKTENYNYIYIICNYTFPLTDSSIN